VAGRDRECVGGAARRLVPDGGTNSDGTRAAAFADERGVAGVCGASLDARGGAFLSHRPASMLTKTNKTPSRTARWRGLMLEAGKVGELGREDAHS